MLNLYMVLTKNCNLKCEHCSVSAGPGNKEYTMSSENFQKVMGNLDEENSINFMLTGGEIFTMQKNLEEYLEIINESRKNQIKNKNDRIWLQTNGLWIHNSNAKNIVEKLSKYNIDMICIDSQDCHFHEEQKGYKGISEELANGVISEKIAWDIVKTKKTKEQPKAMALGRGEQFKKGYYNCKERCGFNLKRKTLVIDWNGDVALCGGGLWRVGNLVEEPISEIIKRNEKKEFMRILRGKSSDVAKYLGMQDTKINKIIAKHGTGGLYAYLHRKDLIPYEHRRIFETK